MREYKKEMGMISVTSDLFQLNNSHLFFLKWLSNIVASTKFALVRKKNSKIK